MDLAGLPPSLFIDSPSSTSIPQSATASDLLNDSSLSQQIEFILQDANELSGDSRSPPSTTSATLSALAAAASTSNRLSLDANGYIITNNSMPTSPQLSHPNEENDEQIDDDVIIKSEPIDDDLLQSMRSPLSNSSIDHHDVRKGIRHTTISKDVKIERMDGNLDDEDFGDYTTEITETNNDIVGGYSSNILMSPLSVELNESEDNPRIVSTSSVLGTSRESSQATAAATFVRVPTLVNVISKCPITQANNIKNSICNSFRRGTIITAQETQMQNSATKMAVLNVVQQPTTSVVVVHKESQQQQQLISSSPSSSIISSTTGTSTTKDLTQNKTTAATTTETSTTRTTTTQTAVAAASAATTATTTTIYQCVECIDRFDSRELYEIHRSGHANNMKCAICNMVLKSLKNYEKHCLRCKPYECQICGRVVRFRPNFIKHMRVHTGQQSERHKYKCDVCHKEFMSFEYFKVHKKIHNENVNLTCEICGKVFSALASLRGHSKLHSGVKLHKCDVCGKGFGQRYNLKIHARTHTGDFPFECKICQKKLHTQSSLQTHMQTHQRDQINQGNATVRFEQQQQPQPKQLESTIVQNHFAIASQDLLDENAQIFDTSSSSSSSITSSVAAVTAAAAAATAASAGKRRNTTRTITIANGNGGVALLTTASAGTTAKSNNNNNNNHYLSRSTNTIYNKSNNNINTTEESSDESNNGAFTSSSLGNNEDRINQSQLSQPQLQRQQQQQLQQPVTRTIVIKNYVQTEPHSSQVTTQQYAQQQQLQQHQILLQREQEEQELELQQQKLSQMHNQATQQQQYNHHHQHHHDNNQLQEQQQTNYNQQLQQQLRKTPIILSTGGANTNISLSLVSVLTSNSIAPNTTSTSTFTSDTTSTSPALSLSPTLSSPLSSQSQSQSPCSSTISKSPILAASSSSVSCPKKLRLKKCSIHHHNQHDEHDNQNIHQCTTTEEDDDKSSPSLATTAIIKVEPNLYSSGDNSVEMFIKEEIFDDCCSAPSSRSPPTSKYHSTFDSDLVQHFSHTLPYGSLFEPNSIPDDSIPANIYADDNDDDDFRLDNSSLGGNLQPSTTTDGEFIKKEWVYGFGTSGYTINGKFDEDSAALCDASSFIYN